MAVRQRAQNVAYYAGLLRHAQELGRATAVLGIGVQGIHTPLGRTAYAEVLRRAAHVSVRDPGDLQVLREELGVDRPCWPPISASAWRPGSGPPSPAERGGWRSSSPACSAPASGRRPMPPGPG